MDEAAEDGVPGAREAGARARADRLAPTIDGVEYYRHLRRALIGARRQVLVVGWDLHSELDLLRGEEAERARREEPWSVRLADLLLQLVEQRPELRVSLLVWEGASLFALERQHLPRMRRPWARHPRLRLEWNELPPPLGSWHEKLVVIDDRLAFAGGMDLTSSRWDSHEHRVADERRRDPGPLGGLGVPYHDLMLAVDGEVAALLGRWCRELWQRATGEALPAPGAPPEHDPWPEALEPLLRGRELHLARTRPRNGEDPGLREVEATYLAQVRAARELVHVETQYLTHEPLVRALAEALAEPEGPEVVLVLPHGCSGRLQALALDPHRDRLLELLRSADVHGRLGVYWPSLRGPEPADVDLHAVYVHAKCMVVDDRLLRIGSSNLASRSMGLDAELDLFTAVEAEDREGREAIASFRRRSLAYLLHVPPEQVAAAEREHGSVVAAIEALRGGERTLVPFEHRAEDVLHRLRLPPELADPDGPLGPEDLERVLGTLRLEDEVRGGLRGLLALARRRRAALLVWGGLLSLLLAWRVTPLAEMTRPERLSAVLGSLSESAAGLSGVLALFVVASALGLPVAVLVTALGAVLAPSLSIPLCLLGCVVSGWIGYRVGRRLPGSTSERVLGPRLERLRRFVADGGVLTVVALRNFPVAPFALVNVGCGAVGVRERAFVLGTLLGMVPGITLIAFLGRELRRWLTQPSLVGLGRMALVAVAVAALALLAARLQRRRRAGHGRELDGEDTGSR